MLNEAHQHLLLNHIPVIAVPMLALVLAWGLLRGHDAMVRFALVGAIIAAPVIRIATWTGHEAEELVEEQPWASHDWIHEHEELGEKAEYAGWATAAIALVALLMSRGKPAHRGASAAVLVALLATSGLLAVTSYEGGKIRHDEVHGLAPDAGQREAPR